MALIPLNRFKTQTAILTSSTTATVYVAPVGVTSIILMAQVANISDQTQYVTLIHSRNVPVNPDPLGNNAQTAEFPLNQTELVKNYAIPANDAAGLIAGKLVVQSIDSVVCYATNSGTCKLTMSVLETANA
jgi:hypothetical protein